MAQQTTEQQITDDLAAIHAAAMDYMQGWYEGDAERLRRCLHPELLKRAVLRDPVTGMTRVTPPLTKDGMVEKTRQGGGTDTPRDRLSYKVKILDLYGDIASVRAESYEYIDYLHVARSDGNWLIVNVLWTMSPSVAAV